jgi:hypothetical protein
MTHVELEIQQDARRKDRARPSLREACNSGTLPEARFQVSKQGRTCQQHVACHLAVPLRAADARGGTAPRQQLQPVLSWRRGGNAVWQAKPPTRSRK